eukprot:Protomagalhaensia_wolfi_Nauph_80__198@NODE_1108_length_1728_cov_140_887507_g843_i0_p2_GENE_NODE_1108_length_1728_cov_140_887507_g843_i0NODE_1108_length_1728_cov_140_887507_g843_i0_p2_ORF_typecomplete_len149_score7_23SUZ/PF12752_7/4_1e05_NODE_1108_length_1728_cov_140_887507_g843_i011741620
MSQPPLMNWRTIAAPSSSTPPSAPPAATNNKKRITLLKRPKLPRGQAPSPDETPGAASDGKILTAQVDAAADRTTEGAEIDSEPDGGRKLLSSKTLKERERAYEEAKRRIWTEQYGTTVAFAADSTTSISNGTYTISAAPSAPIHKRN